MKKIYSLLLLTAALVCLPGTVKAETLTVADDTYQKDKLPIDSYNCDVDQHNQFIFPATELEAMKGKIITGIKFHTANASYSWSPKGSPTFTFKFAEVEETTLSGFNTEASFTTVYTGQAVFANNAWDITFDDSYSYQGGNLLIDISSAAAGYISTVYFYSAEYASAGWANSAGYSYLPKTTFTYEAVIEGPGLKVADGAATLATGAEYSFGLATAGTAKEFKLSNPGTESITLNIAATNGFGVSPANVTIEAKAETTLTVTMADATGDGVVTITPTAPGVDAFEINVSGTVKDPKKLWCNFSEGLPDGWSNPDGYTIGTSGAGTGTSNGGYAQTGYGNKLLYTPLVTVAEGEKIYLLVSGYSASVSFNKLTIQYSADGSNWTDAKALTNIAYGTGVWTSVEVTEIPAGNWYIGFYGYCVYFTDIYGGSLPAMPKNVAASDITATGATISWDKYDSETAWQISYSTTSGAPAGGTLVNADATTKTLTELNPSTIYYVSVRIVNGDDTYSDWSNEISFRTECGAVTPLGWAEGFESFTAGSSSNLIMPDCWNGIGAFNVNSSTYPQVYVTTDTYNEGSKSLKFDNKNANYGVLLLPEFSGSLSALQLEFTHKEESSSYSGKVEFGYVTDIADAGTFNQLFVVENISTNWVREAPIALTSVPSGARLAFRYKSNNQYNYYVAIDDISITALPVCAAPTNLVATSKPDGATISWIASNGETQFQYRIGEGEWTLLDENTLSVTISELASGTEGIVYVRAYCSEETQSPAASVNFTALCPAPTAPQVSDIAQTTATLSWTAASGITKYQYVVLEKDEAENWDEAKDVEATTVELDGLTANTAYDVYVRSWYSDKSQSASVKVSFLTECAAIATLPWTENFNELTELSQCWATAGASSTISISAGSYVTMELDNNALFFSGEGATYAYALLPEFEAALDTLQIAFAHREESANETQCGKIELGYYKDGAFTALKVCDIVTEMTNVDAFALTDVPEGARIAFAYKAASTNYTAAVDDITVSVKPETPSAIGNTGSETKAVKAIENGHLIIIREGVKYNAQGAKL